MVKVTELFPELKERTETPRLVPQGTGWGNRIKAKDRKYYEREYIQVTDLTPLKVRPMTDEEKEAWLNRGP